MLPLICNSLPAKCFERLCPIRTPHHFQRLYRDQQEIWALLKASSPHCSIPKTTCPIHQTLKASRQTSMNSECSRYMLKSFHYMCKIKMPDMSTSGCITFTRICSSHCVHFSPFRNPSSTLSPEAASKQFQVVIRILHNNLHEFRERFVWSREPRNMWGSFALENGLLWTPIVHKIHIHSFLTVCGV